MTDAELVLAARQGSREAREQLARRWSRCALAVCLSRVRRRDLAEDLAQESLIRALTHLHALEDTRKFGSWLRGIAIRVCQDWLRRAQRESSRLPEGRIAAETMAIGQELMVEEERHQLMHELELLPEELREVLCLHYFEGRSYEEIAELLDVARSTVNSRLSQARRLLLQRLTIPMEAPK